MGNGADPLSTTPPHRTQSVVSLFSCASMSMPLCTASRVARRFLASTIRTPITAHVDPLGHAWGWFADCTPRMHIVPMAPEHRGAARVWLERGGHRAFEIDHIESGTGLDPDELRSSVLKARDTIEAAWLCSCESRGWLAYSPREATIALYFGTPHQLVRRLRESALVPDLIQPDASTNSIWLEVRANRLIWQGADDGSDAGPTSKPYAAERARRQ